MVARASGKFAATHRMKGMSCGSLEVSVYLCVTSYTRIREDRAAHYVRNSGTISKTRTHQMASHHMGHAL